MNQRKLSDLQLERLLADALSPAEKTALEKVLAESPGDAEALRLLRAESDAFLLSSPPVPFAEKVMPSPKRSPFAAWWGALVAVAAAVALVVWSRGGKPDDDDVRVKGSVAWRTVVNGGSSLRAGASVAEGDTLTFEVTSPTPRWVAVVSHAPDGWFLYVPATEVKAGVTLLPVGAKLDAAKGSEVLHLVSSEQPFDAEQVKQQLSAQQPVGSVSVETLAFTKP